MSMRIQVRVYPGNIDSTTAEYLYSARAKDTLPKKGDAVRFDMSNTGEAEGWIEAVSWSKDFDLVIVDVVTKINDRVRQLATEFEWTDIRNGVPKDSDDGPMFVVG
jgi:hypothetical protein